MYHVSLGENTNEGGSAATERGQQREREREMGGWGKAGEEGEIFFSPFLFPPASAAGRPQHHSTSTLPPPLLPWLAWGASFINLAVGGIGKREKKWFFFPSALKKSLHLNLGEEKGEEASHSPPPPRRPIAVLKVESGGGREKPFRLLRKLHPACFGHRHQHQRASSTRWQ